MIKKKLFLLFFFLLIILGLLTIQSIRGGGPAADFLSYPVTILEKGITAVKNAVTGTISKYLLVVGREEENRRLKNRIVELEAEKNELLEARLEVQRLRKLLKLKSERRDVVAVARVFARDPSNWFRMIWIDKGRKSGIRRDMVAVTPAGPVGRVNRVLENSSSVMLITDINSAVAVRTQTSRLEGILEGSGGDECYLKYIPGDAAITPGERLITSGLDRIFPKGLMIGTVTEVRKEGGDMFQHIVVKPVQDLKKIEEVAILKR
jgi:rod shape-determining protein MreC